MSNVIQLVPAKASKASKISTVKEATLDESPILTKYEALFQLRSYLRYTLNDTKRVGEVTDLIISNLKEGYDFPVVPTHIYDEYEGLAVPNSISTSVKLEEAFDEYAKTCL